MARNVFEVFDTLRPSYLSDNGFFRNPEYILKTEETEFGTPFLYSYLEKRRTRYDFIPISFSEDLLFNGNNKSISFFLKLLIGIESRYPTLIRKVLIKNAFLYITSGLVFNENKEPILLLTHKESNNANISIDTIFISPKLFNKENIYYNYVKKIVDYLILDKGVRLVVEDFNKRFFLYSKQPDTFIDYQELSNKGLSNIKNERLILL